MLHSESVSKGEIIRYHMNSISVSHVHYAVHTSMTDMAYNLSLRNPLFILLICCTEACHSDGHFTITFDKSTHLRHSWKDPQFSANEILQRGQVKRPHIYRLSVTDGGCVDIAHP